MMPADSMSARYAKTQGSRVSDPSVARYLRTEYRGGMTLEELQPIGPAAKVRAAVVRLVKAVLLERNRVKPTPATLAP